MSTHSKHSFRLWLALPVFLLTLVACTVTVSPEWVRTYNHNADVDSDRLTWLDDMKVDSYGNIVLAGTALSTQLGNREQRLLFVKFNSRGDRLWARDLKLGTGDYRSDEDTRVMVLDNAGNLYAVARQIRFFDDRTEYASHLVSLDPSGNERWRTKLSDAEDMHGLKLENNKLYVVGASTRVFSLNGTERSRIDHSDHEAGSIDVSATGETLLGGGQGVSLYSSAGDRRWFRKLPEGGHASGEARFALGGDIIAATAIAPRGSARVTRYSPNGTELWTKTFSAPRQSYGLQGPAMIREDYRGDIYLVASNSEGRRVVKMDSSGSVYWNKATGSGIVQDVALADGGLFLVGAGQNEKYTSDGDRVAMAETGSSVQETQGRVSVDGDLIYGAYSARQNGSYGLHLSQFKNR